FLGNIHGGQWRNRAGGSGEIVKPDDGDVLGNAVSELLKCAQSVQCNEVVVRKIAAGHRQIGAQKLLDLLIKGTIDGVQVMDDAPGNRKTVFLDGAQISPFPLYKIVQPCAVTKVPGLSVPFADQVGDGGIRALFVVDYNTVCMRGGQRTVQ